MTLGSLLRAYLQGIEEIASTVTAQIIEQLLRVGLLILLLPLAIGQVSNIRIAAIAMAITLIGEVFSTL